MIAFALATAPSATAERNKRNKNGAMCLSLSKALSLVPSSVANPLHPQALRRWSAAEAQAEAAAAGLGPGSVAGFGAGLAAAAAAAGAVGPPVPLAMGAGPAAGGAGSAAAAAAGSSVGSSPSLFPSPPSSSAPGSPSASASASAPASPASPLVLLGVVSTGACLSTSESVAGTGYRHEQRVSLGGADLSLFFELSIRSSFQQRGKPKGGGASKGATNSNRLQIQEESDLLVQAAPGIAVATVAPNASLTKKHYPYLRLAQRTDGPLLAQQACGSIGQFVVTHRLLWGPPGTDIATLRVDRPTPLCKHGRSDEHDDCRFLEAYTIREEIIVQDGRGGWAELTRRQFNLKILGEKQIHNNGSSDSSPKGAPVSTTKRKQAAVVAAVAAAATAELEPYIAANNMAAAKRARTAVDATVLWHAQQQLHSYYADPRMCLPYPIPPAGMQ